MGIRETLQDALVNANNERIKWHDVVQGYDDQLVGLKAKLGRAETEKAGADRIHKDAEEEYRGLMAHAGRQTDQQAQQALSPEIERLAQNVNFTIRTVQVAGERVRCQREEIEELQRQRASAQINLTLASERWEQIKKQIEDLNH
jgi:hypothetical protein